MNLMRKTGKTAGTICLVFCLLCLAAVPGRTVLAAEGVYGILVGGLKAERPEQRLVISVNGLNFSRSMAELAEMPVVVQENADGSKNCLITDPALADALITEINAMLAAAPRAESAWFYEETTGTFFPYDILISDSVSDMGRLKILNQLQAGLVGIQDGDIQVNLSGNDLHGAIQNVPEELMAYRYTIKGSCTTSYRTSSSNRCNNVELAAANINHMVILPGQEVSMNEAFKPRTSANGYREAGAYLNGKTVPAIGGGICQVSSTVYNAVMNAGLTVTERHPHSMSVSYLPLGVDAAISSGSKDLKVRNDYPFPVFVEAYTQNKNLTVNIYTNESLTQGTAFRLHSVRTGSLSAKAYLEISLNGTVLEDRYIGSSYYNPHLPDTDETEDD